MLIYRNEYGCQKPAKHPIPLMSFREIIEIKRGPIGVLT